MDNHGFSQGHISWMAGYGEFFKYKFVAWKRSDPWTLIDGACIGGRAMNVEPERAREVKKREREGDDPPLCRRLPALARGKPKIRFARRPWITIVSGL
jgi:hypothetical protein